MKMSTSKDSNDHTSNHSDKEDKEDKCKPIAKDIFYFILLNCYIIKNRYFI